MDLYEGALIEVVVTSVRQFGVLVEFEGRKGIIEIPNFSWNVDDVNGMLEAMRPGQRIEAKVLVFVPGHSPQEFSASIKDVHPELDPWIDPRVYAEGTVHSAVVRLIFDFGGAVVRLPNGADAFVPSLRPGTRMNDQLSIVVKTVNVERKKIEAEQI